MDPTIFDIDTWSKAGIVGLCLMGAFTWVFTVTRAFLRWGDLAARICQSQYLPKVLHENCKRRRAKKPELP